MRHPARTAAAEREPDLWAFPRRRDAGQADHNNGGKKAVPAKLLPRRKIHDTPFIISSGRNSLPEQKATQ